MPLSSLLFSDGQQLYELYRWGSKGASLITGILLLFSAAVCFRYLAHRRMQRIQDEWDIKDNPLRKIISDNSDERKEEHIHG